MIELMDGGFLYELRKHSQDYGETIIDNNPELIEKIHKDYIDIGCKYIISGNYVFKPMRQENWEYYTEKVFNILHKLKENNDFTLLGCMPPYYESYTDGDFNSDVVLYYLNLKQIVDKYADKYIIETIVSYQYLYNICKILDNGLPIIISLYPKNDITVENLVFLTQRFNIEAILINCCSFDMMEEYFNIILKGDFSRKIKFGFYLNKIDEQQYLAVKNGCDNGRDDRSAINLEQFYIDRDNDLNKIHDFCKKYDLSNNLIIGGCCGYGVEDMKVLKTKLIV